MNRYGKTKLGKQAGEGRSQLDPIQIEAIYLHEYGTKIPKRNAVIIQSACGGPMIKTLGY